MTWVSWLGVLLPPFLQHFPLLRFSRSANKSKIEMNIKGMAITTWEIFCKRVNPLQESEIVSLISEKRETMSFDHCFQFILFSLLIQWAASSSVVSGNSLFVLIVAIWFFSLFFFFKIYITVGLFLDVCMQMISLNLIKLPAVTFSKSKKVCSL